MDEIKDLMNKKGAEPPAPPPTEIKPSTFDKKIADRKRRKRFRLAVIGIAAILIAAVAGYGILRGTLGAKTKVAQGEAGSKAKTSLKSIEVKSNHLIIRRLGIDVPIYDNTEPGPLKQDDLLKGATYYDENTNKPGTGNAVIFAHSAVSSEHDAPFGKIGEGEVKVGDEIVLTDAGKKQFVYVVKEVNTIEATDFSVVRPLGEDEPPILTLITCIAPDYPRDKRLAVIANLKT